jgi:hypothetical protein
MDHSGITTTLYTVSAGNPRAVGSWRRAPITVMLGEISHGVSRRGEATVRSG